jgi:diguanylate cyclase (GGDEF)-like protein
MVQESYDTTVNTYDTLSEETTEMLKKGIDENCKGLQISARLIGQSGVLSRKDMLDSLMLLALDSGFNDLAIVDAEGKGINIAGTELDYSGEEFYRSAMRGMPYIASAQTDESAIIYAVPVLKDGDYRGVLVAKQDAPLDSQGNFNLDPSYIGKNTIYILNENNEPVAYQNAADIGDFDYEATISEGYLYDASVDHNPSIGLSLFSKGSHTGNAMTVWYQKPLGINNWSVLIGRSDILNPVTQNIIRISNILWIVILSGVVLLFLTLIIYQRRSNQKLIQMLYLDPVTGGSNWYKFRMDVDKILNSRLFFKKKYALINFDINRFKIINDSFGHQKGDEVLKDIYSLVRKWVRPGEPFTRYSADQFYILLSFQEPEEVNHRILELNHRLHQLRYMKTVKFYFGVYFITERKDSIDRMGDFAGMAKHNIKGSNEGIISFFDDNSREKLLEEEKIEKTMHDALKNNEFLVYLQPKYTTVEEKVSGAEALVRWNNGSGQLISPGFFIPLFEKNGFITELDMYMLKNVCRIQKGWLDKGYKPLPVSVNISRIHFANPYLADIIRDTVDEYEVPHELIELELSESAFLQNKQMLIATVTLLREYGFLVSMDDFGAGYSSLNSLKDLPLDVVKLDGELFRLTDEVERGQTVIRNTISMAKDLHMKVVAECIETREQVDFLCTVGCDIIQGYYYARPMPVDQFESRYLTQGTGIRP